MPKTFEFDDWELAEMSSRAAAVTLEYMGHYGGAGLKRGEVQTMNRWNRLSAKLAGDPVPDEIPYVGTRRNNWDRNAD